MRTPDVRIAVSVAVALALVACGERSSPPDAARPQPVAAAPAPQPVAPAPATPAPPAQATPAPPPSAPAAPAEVARPSAAPKPAAPPPAATEPRDAGPAPARPPAEKAPAHAAVGADKCRMCHRLQHQSWAASPHAAKRLDCEGCHGNGGDYWPAAVMRDRARAVAAGLVVPALASCKRCHGAKADAALLERVHAHKAK